MTVLEVLQTVAGVKLGLQRKHPSQNMDELVQIIVGGYQGGYPAANSAALLMDALVSDGGTVNTGDAAVGDVANGKTFSSASLTNVAGTSTKNATVPTDAPIQPPQAFVDFVYQYNCIGHPPSLPAPATIDFKNKGVTKIASVLVSIFNELGQWTELDLSGNALTTSEIDSIMASALAIFNEPGVTNYMDFSGGTSQSPTGGAAWADAWALSYPQQLIVSFNLHGHIAVINAAGATGIPLRGFNSNFDNCSMSAAEVNALFAFLVANYLVQPGIVSLVGNDAAPTGQGLTDKQTLIDNGWTVTTN